jgi:hypothetical protein
MASFAVAIPLHPGFSQPGAFSQGGTPAAFAKGAAMLIYVTNPGLAIAAGLKLGFNFVSGELGDKLVTGHNAYDMRYPRAFPAIGYVDPEADTYTPPAPTPAPPPPPPAPPPCDAPVAP